VVCPRVRTVGLVLLVHHWWWRPSPWWMIARHCGRRALHHVPKHGKMKLNIRTSSVHTHVEGYGWIGGDRGRTSHLPAAVSSHRIYRHHGFSTKHVR
jgi:hypothetical protein